MAYPIPTPTPNQVPPSLDIPKDIDLSQNYRLTKDQEINASDICYYIESIDQSIFAIDCSRIFPLENGFDFLYDFIENTTDYLENNEIYTQDLLSIQNKILAADDKRIKRKNIYDYFDLLKKMNLKIVYIFSNFHHLAEKIEDYEYHILYQHAFECKTFNLWFLSCDNSVLNNSALQNDIASKMTLLSTEQINTIYQESSFYTNMEKQTKKDMLKIFISYSHKDNEAHKTFMSIVSLYTRDRSIAIWNDQQIEPGEEWDLEIKEQLTSSRIVIFLVSERLLSSDYIERVEIKTTLERQQKGEVTILPIIIEKCNFEDSPLSKFETLSPKGVSIKGSENETQCWSLVIERLIKKIQVISENSNTIQQTNDADIAINQSGNHNNIIGINKGTIIIK